MPLSTRVGCGAAVGALAIYIVWRVRGRSSELDGYFFWRLRGRSSQLDGVDAPSFSGGGQPEYRDEVDAFAALAGLPPPKRGAWIDMMIELAQQIQLPLTISSAVEAGEQSVLYVNPPFSELTGYTFEELEGRSLRVLDGKKTEPSAKKKIHNALSRGQPITVTFTSYSKHNESARHRLRVQPIFDKQGMHCYTVSMQIDVDATPMLLPEFDRLSRGLPTATAPRLPHHDLRTSIERIWAAFSGAQPLKPLSAPQSRDDSCKVSRTPTSLRRAATAGGGSLVGQAALSSTSDASRAVPSASDASSSASSISPLPLPSSRLYGTPRDSGSGPPSDLAAASVVELSEEHLRLLELLQSENSSSVQSQDELEVICALGFGSFGEVSLYRNRYTHELTVVKRVPLRNVSDREVRQLASEVRNGMKLRHPCIVQGYGAFFSVDEVTHIRSLCMTFEYAAGDTLANAIHEQREEGGGFESEWVVGSLVQIASAVAYMHSHSVLHRDLSSANIFFASDAHDVLLIGDLGLSKKLEVRTTARIGGAGSRVAGTAAGTPAYLAPELVTGQAYGKPADIWAVGVLLFEMLALVRPFEGTNLMHTCLLIGNGSARPEASQALAECGHPPELTELVGPMGLLNVDPKLRMSFNGVLSRLKLPPSLAAKHGMRTLPVD